MCPVHGRIPTLNRFSLGRGTLSTQPILSPCRKCTSTDLAAGTGPKQLCHQAPVSIFDGTLISDMSFGTLKAQIMFPTNLPVRSAEKGTVSRNDTRSLSCGA